ncbi:MAG: 2-oxoacid:acceptor oxidoreductase family protein [Bacillota bacterium]|jgi:indolepyruvate ferredoxin oxidoreductase beta subunit
MNKTLDIYLVGVGGQGILTIADFICQAALANDIAVSYFPTKGMSQRGGFVKAQIRLGKPTAGPSIPSGSADMAIAMENSEALKALRYLKKDGEFVLYGGIWQPTDVMLKKAPYPETEGIQNVIKENGAKLIYGNFNDVPEFNGTKVRENIFALGLAVGSSKLGEMISVDLIADLIAKKWPKVKEQNLLAFNAGVEKAKNN